MDKNPYEAPVEKAASIKQEGAADEFNRNMCRRLLWATLVVLLTVAAVALYEAAVMLKWFR